MQLARAQQARVHAGPARAQSADCIFCLGWGRPASTDLRSNGTINCTSSVEADTAHKEAHVAAKAAYARSSSQGSVQQCSNILASR